MNVPQFFYAEFERLLWHIAEDTENHFFCRPITIIVIKRILTTDYSFRADDIEYLMDMTNYQIRLQKYTGKKSRFPISRHLDQFCQDELYINTALSRP